MSSNNFIDAHTTGNSGNSTKQQSTRLYIIPGVPESTAFNPQTRKEISKIQWHPIEDLPTKFGQDNSFYNVVNFVKVLKQWIKTAGQNYTHVNLGRKKKVKQITVDKQLGKKQLPSAARTTTTAWQLSNKFNAANQEIFDKLRLKNDNSPVNSVLMRDNPSPIHLFEKLSAPSNTQAESKKDKVLKAIKIFAECLKTLKINRSVIRESINKCF